jgi:DNA-binding response OmpR family regulator
MIMKILLAEDEKRMAKALCELLALEKYDVTHFADGESALSAGLTGIYDVIVLDVMMPQLGGFEVAKRLRKNGIKTPILMLTAKSDVDDKVTGLDSGADDYLTKPFNTKELLARLRALCRRSADTDDNSLHFGDISLDLGTAMLSCVTNGQSVRLGDKEFRIMEYMLKNCKQILTREQLALKIWGYDNEAEYNNVEVYMSFTRKKLNFIGAKTEIKAVRGIGYELRYKDV